MPFDTQPPPADAYLFGPIENKQHRIIGLAMILNAELPAPVDEFIVQIFGKPTLSGSDFRLWRLAEPISYVNNDWRWLKGALEWDSWHRLGCEVSFTEWLGGNELAEGLMKANGSEFNIFGPEASELVDRYRASKRVEPEASLEPRNDKGFQRLLYRTWAIRDPNLKPVHRLTLFAILRYCWSKDRCEVWEATLADDVGCDVRTLQRALAVLVKHQYISVTNRHRQKSIYRVLRKELIPPYPKKANAHNR